MTNGALSIASLGVALLLAACAGASGNLWSWGSNGSGELGDGTRIQRITPVRAVLPRDVAAVTAGDAHSAALATNERFQWGDLGCHGSSANITPMPSAFPGAVQIAAGTCHALALKSDGTVWAWGRNFYGELGDGTNLERLLPVQVPGLTNVTAIDAGGAHSLALRADGTVWAWGINLHGQLGIGSSADQSSPVQVTGLTNVVAISASGGPPTGSQHSMALRTDGTVWTWGRAYGTASLTPVQLAEVNNAVRIEAAYQFGLILLANGTVLAFGYNVLGQLGDGTVVAHDTPAAVSGLSQVAALAAGQFHGLALLRDGSLRAWGSNDHGQLGDGTTSNRLTPVVVPGLFNVESISAAAGQSFALLAPKRPQPDFCLLDAGKWTCKRRGPIRELPHCPLGPPSPGPVPPIPCPTRPHVRLCTAITCAPCLAERTCAGERFELRFDGRVSDLRPVIMDHDGRVVGRAVDMPAADDGTFDRRLQFQALSGADYELVVLPGSDSRVGVPLSLPAELVPTGT